MVSNMDVTTVGSIAGVVSYATLSCTLLANAIAGKKVRCQMLNALPAVIARHKPVASTERPYRIKEKGDCRLSSRCEPQFPQLAVSALLARPVAIISFSDVDNASTI